MSSARATFVKDFNAALEGFFENITERIHKASLTGGGQQLRLPLIILTLSDPAERSNSFLNKMFFASNQKHPKFRTMLLNPPTDALIDKVLRQIVREEGVNHLSDTRLVEIRSQAQRDLRNAIMNLQFSAAGSKLPRQQTKQSKAKFN